MPDSVHSRLRAEITKTGLTLKAFAVVCGVPYRTLQDYVAGKRYPGGENLAKIATHLRVSVDSILIGVEQLRMDRVADPSARYVSNSEKIADIIKELSEKERTAVLEFAEFIKGKKGE